MECFVGLRTIYNSLIHLSVWIYLFAFWKLPCDIQPQLKNEQETPEYAIPCVYPFDLGLQQYLLSYHWRQDCSCYVALTNFTSKNVWYTYNPLSATHLPTPTTLSFLSSKITRIYSSQFSALFRNHSQRSSHLFELT